MLYHLQTYLKYFAFLGLVPWTDSCNFLQHLQRAYTVFLLLLNFVIFGITFKIAQEDEVFLSLMINVIIYISKIVATHVILLQVMFQYDGYNEFCMRLKYIRLRLQRDLNVFLGKLSLRCLIKIIALGIVCMLSVFPPIYVAIDKGLVYFWASLLSIVTLRLQCVLLLLYMDLMRNLVEMVAKRLKDVLDCHLRGTGVICILDGNCQKLCSLEFLLAIKQSYMEIHQLFTFFNSLFGWSLLSICVVAFLDSTVNIYWTQQVLSGAYDSKYLYATFAVVVPSFLLICATCRCGELCSRQNMLIGSYVRGLASNPQALREPAYIDLLTEFILQVEHNELHFNVEGFMVIDNSFFMSILAAMVTYLIVLMQFSAL
ncbi:hypothetical protein KR018_002893 [Drosophila ironensis]|nr:hypothetical protein KR018_002893 [Drosophila ironensis]